MFNLFGSKKKEASTVSSTSSRPVTNPQTTIVKLRESIATQEKREEHIQKKVDQMVKEAKVKLGKKDKKGKFRRMSQHDTQEMSIYWKRRWMMDISISRCGGPACGC